MSTKLVGSGWYGNLEDFVGRTALFDRDHVFGHSFTARLTTAGFKYTNFQIDADPYDLFVPYDTALIVDVYVPSGGGSGSPLVR